MPQSSPSQISFILICSIICLSLLAWLSSQKLNLCKQFWLINILFLNGQTRLIEVYWRKCIEIQKGCEALLHRNYKRKRFGLRVIFEHIHPCYSMELELQCTSYVLAILKFCLNDLVIIALLHTNSIFLQCQFSINIYLSGGLKYVPDCQKLLSPPLLRKKKKKNCVVLPGKQ